MYGIKQNNQTLKTTNDLQEAMNFAQNQLQTVTVYDINTGATLYEYAPSIGLKEFLVD
jgi:hypothetical protein